MRNTFDAVLFSTTIKVWRKLSALTAQEMANLADIAPSTYSFIETGDRPPTMAEFSRLLQLMDMEAKDFFNTKEKASHG